jgi:hypothetical protein
MTPGCGIRDGKRISIRIQDEHPGHISMSLETVFSIFGAKNTYIL